MTLEVSTGWVCPNCTFTRLTPTAVQHTVIHNCAGLGGLIAPLVRAGTKCKVDAIEREDYLNGEQVGTIMAVRTTRDDGIDALVFAPVAQGGGR